MRTVFGIQILQYKFAYGHIIFESGLSLANADVWYAHLCVAPSDLDYVIIWNSHNRKVFANRHAKNFEDYVI